VHFPISYSKPMRLLSVFLGMGPRHSAVDVGDETVDIRMGWAFYLSARRGAVTGARHAEPLRYTRGVHGHSGRYRVNGRGDGLVTISFGSPQRGLMIGFSVNVSEVTVSVDDPDGLVGALGEGSTR
jgi:hypothetical protein